MKCHFFQRLFQGTVASALASDERVYVLFDPTNLLHKEWIQQYSHKPYCFLTPNDELYHTLASSQKLSLDKLLAKKNPTLLRACGQKLIPIKSANNTTAKSNYHKI